MDYAAWGMGHGRGHARHGARGWSHLARARGTGRLFEGRELRLVFLAMIAEAPRHGYELIRQVEERSGGAYAPSPGIVYPTLAFLAETGLVEEQVAPGAKKRFALTGEGRRHLADNQPEVDALMARLTGLGAGRDGHDGAPIRRAMANLGAVLGERLHRSDVDRETVHRVADLIDEVARKIERMQ